MLGLILAPLRDSYAGPQPPATSGAPPPPRPMAHDATNEFQVKAREFRDVHGLAEPIFYLNDLPPGRPDHDTFTARRGLVISLIRSARGPLDVIALFGHGVPDSLWSARILRADVPDLARAILAVGRHGTRFIAYGCAAATPGGILEDLSRLLGPAVPIFGHLEFGPSSSNPMWIRFPGGHWVVAQDDPNYDTWKDALANTDLWARFPFMEPEELRNELTARRAAGGGPGKHWLPRYARDR